MWILSVFGQGAMLWLLSIVQTLAWSFAIWLLAREVIRTRIAWAALPFAYLALLNPTLTLSSLTVGYETLAGATQVLAVALMLQDLRQTEAHSWWRFPLAGAVLGYSIALQPRLLIGASALLLVWLIARKPWQQSLALGVVAGLLMAMFPLGLMVRNQVANGRAVISSNLGVNMMMGVGADSTGTYGSQSKQVNCGTLPKDSIDADNAKVACALNWYIENPGQTLRLAWIKSQHFWSSWWGPYAAGTTDFVSSNLLCQHTVVFTRAKL